MSVAEEEWVKAAMSDDTMVVDLLVRLHSAASPPPSKPAAPPLEWSVRQRRSKKQAAAQRASPTTPLSWSGATSLGGGSGAAAAEESSRPPIEKTSSAARSNKVTGDSEKTVSKRSRKKKTLAELKNEESSLLKERRNLKRELVVVRVNLEKQRATNENLKRMKIQLQPVPDTKTTSIAEESISHQLIISDNAVTLQSSSSNGCPETNTAPPSDPKFVLPDLNMPFEEDLCPEVVCGVS